MFHDSNEKVYICLILYRDQEMEKNGVIDVVPICTVN